MILDLGCGCHKESRASNVVGIDHFAFPDVDIVRDLRRGLPFSDGTVEAVIARHILEHFDGEDLIFIVEEVWRVCMAGAKVYIEVPGTGSPNCGKDFTHKKKDWDQWSFQMWEKHSVENQTGNDQQEYLIERGPLYGIRGEFGVSYQFNPGTHNAHYELRVIK